MSVDGEGDFDKITSQDTHFADQLAGQDGPFAADDLISAAAGGKIENVVEILRSGVDIETKNDQGETALLKAAYHGRTKVVETLLNANADPNSVDAKGKTPLRRAYDNEDIARALLEAKADPNAADTKSKGTTMHRAAEGGYVDVVQFLLEHKGNPNSANSEGETPLHDAATFGQTIVAQVLIAAGADVIAADNAGNTPLHNCTYGNSLDAGLEVSTLLLDAGADSKLKNKQDEDFDTLVEIARQRNI